MTQTTETTPVRSQRGTVLVDLSLEISNGMPAHALFPSPIILPYVTHEQAKFCPSLSPKARWLSCVRVCLGTVDFRSSGHGSGHDPGSRRRDFSGTLASTDGAA